jgi:hypothetical protein
MVVTRKSPGYQVDQRVAIALDALDDEPRRAIGEMIKDRAHFLASLGESRKIRRISEVDPVFALGVPSGLQLIYSRVGDEIIVMDLMHEANLAGFGPRGVVGSKASSTRTARTAPRAEKAK